MQEATFGEADMPCITAYRAQPSCRHHSPCPPPRRHVQMTPIYKTECVRHSGDTMLQFRCT